MWGAEVTEKVIASTVAAKRSETDANQTKGFRNQECLNKLFTKENTARLPREFDMKYFMWGLSFVTKKYQSKFIYEQNYFRHIVTMLALLWTL